MSTPTSIPAPIQPVARTGLAIVLMITGLWVMSFADALAKHLVMSGFAIMVTLWIRYVSSLLCITLVIAPVCYRQYGRNIMATRHPKLQLIRGLFMLLSTLLFYSMVSIMPLAESTSMNFCAPLIVLALSPWLLGEPSRISRWIAVTTGFTGMLIVIRPGGDIPLEGMLLGFGSASVFAMFSIWNRKANKAEDPYIALFYGSLFGTVVTSLALPLFWHEMNPTMLDWCVFAGVGMVATAGHLLMNLANRNTAEASILMPFSYGQIISAVAVGWMMFGQFPDAMTLIGIAIICASGVGIGYVEYQRRRRK